jgi:hypothetical protein
MCKEVTVQQLLLRNSSVDTVSLTTREYKIMEETLFVWFVPRAIQQGLVVQLLLSQLRVTVVRSVNLVAEAGDNQGSQRKGNVHH